MSEPLAEQVDPPRHPADDPEGGPTGAGVGLGVPTLGTHNGHGWAEDGAISPVGCLGVNGEILRESIMLSRAGDAKPCELDDVMRSTGRWYGAGY